MRSFFCPTALGRVPFVFFVSAFCLLPSALIGQAPATEVYLATLTVKGAQAVVGPAVNISQNPGYDNQPSFLPDNSAILFSSNRDGKQMDIYRYVIASKQLSRVTTTDDSEYSPLVTPDRKTFSVVRGTAQHLWRFALDGTDAGPIVKQEFRVGYHVWIDATHLALFVLAEKGEPNTLQLFDTVAGTSEIVARSVGRSLLVRPGTGMVSFMSTAEPRMVNAIDPRSRVITSLVAPLEGSQDAVWLADGRLVMARGRTLYAWTPGTTTWSELVTIPTVSTTTDPITRMAVSPDGRWIAFVAGG